MNAVSTTEYALGLGAQAKAASALMAKASTASKNHALLRLAVLLRENTAALQSDNAKDLERAVAAGLAAPMVDRLRLTPKVLETCAQGCEQLAAMPDVIGDITGNVSDPQQALKEAAAARQCGFRRGLALHPAVIEQLNRGLTPTPEEVAEAHRVLERYPSLEVRPVNWEIHEGRIIDRYEAERARQVIDWEKICLERDAEKAAMIAQTRARLDSGGGS